MNTEPLEEPTETQIEIQKKMVEICGDNLYALQFWQGICDAVLTWDHIEDGLEVDQQMAHRAFSYLLLDAPLNRFFDKYKESIVPVLVNAVSSWQFSNEDGAPKIKAFDIYTEIACTMAFIIGGRKAVDKYIPEIRRLSWQNCQEDDLKDGGDK